VLCPAVNVTIPQRIASETQHITSHRSVSTSGHDLAMDRAKVTCQGKGLVQLKGIQGIGE
jgi:hypothetical protein